MGIGDCSQDASSRKHKSEWRRSRPPVEGWQALLEAIDAAKEKHGVSGTTYAEVLRGLLEKLSLLEARSRTPREPRRPT